jgi:hypothetical protein
MKNSTCTIWPNDADGDVMRLLQSRGLDFDEPTDIDFNVDFEAWPPAEKFMYTLRAQYSLVKMYPPDSTGNGYVLFVVNAALTYELVMFIQLAVSELASPYGGICESWGVLH